MSKPVVLQHWEESEAGWGTRPDGVTLHLSEEHRRQYVLAYWKEEHERTGGKTPSEYTREVGDPIVFDVDQETYDKLVASSDGSLRLWRSAWIKLREELKGKPS